MRISLQTRCRLAESRDPVSGCTTTRSDAHSRKCGIWDQDRERLARHLPYEVALQNTQQDLPSNGQDAEKSARITMCSLPIDLARWEWCMKEKPDTYASFPALSSLQLLLLKGTQAANHGGVVTASCSRNLSALFLDIF